MLSFFPRMLALPHLPLIVVASVVVVVSSVTVAMVVTPMGVVSLAILPLTQVSRKPLLHLQPLSAIIHHPLMASLILPLLPTVLLFFLQVFHPQDVSNVRFINALVTRLLIASITLICHMKDMFLRLVFKHM